jgi:hypothetical protein
LVFFLAGPLLAFDPMDNPDGEMTQVLTPFTSVIVPPFFAHASSLTSDPFATAGAAAVRTAAAIAAVVNADNQIRLIGLLSV